MGKGQWKTPANREYTHFTFCLQGVFGLSGIAGCWCATVCVRGIVKCIYWLPRVDSLLNFIKMLQDNPEP